MKNFLKFREATIKDLPALVLLLQEDKLGQAREDSSKLVCYEEAFYAIDSDPNHLILVVEENGLIFGCVQISYLPNLTFKGTWRAQLEGVRIKSTCRGQGLGKQLINEAILLCKARGCGIIQLTANKQRTESITFYEQIGFKNTHAGMKLYLN